MSVAVARTQPGDSTAAIVNITISIALFSAMDAMVKWLGSDYPVMQLLFFRSAFALIPLGVLMYQCGGWRELKTRQPGLQMVRALIGLASMGCFFLAFQLMPLADVIAIAFTGPLFLTILSIPLLGEKVGPRRWAAVTVGFLGVLLIARPGSDIFGPAALLPLAGALGFAFAMIYVRRLSSTDSNSAIVFYHAVVCILATGAALPFEWRTPEPVHWLPLVALGLIGGTAQIFMTQAFRLAPAVVIAPFKYTAILFAIVYGYVFFDDMPDTWTLAGACVVIASGLYILHRETVRKAEARRLALKD